MGFTHADTAIAQATSSVASQSVTLSGAVSIGDLILLVEGSPNPNLDTVTDNSPGGSQPWINPNASVNFSQFVYAIANKAAPSGMTITITGGGSGTRFIVADRFTANGPISFGSAASTAISGTSGNMGSISSVPAGELLWGGAHADTGSAIFTAGSSNSVSAVIGSQVGNTGGSGFSQYILSGAGGTESMTWTSTVSLGGVAAGAWEAYFTFVPSARKILLLAVPDEKPFLKKLLYLGEPGTVSRGPDIPDRGFAPVRPGRARERAHGPGPTLQPPGSGPQEQEAA